MGKSVNKEILRLAIPNILSNISVPLLSAVDTALMGRLSVEHLGAVGLGSMIFNFIYWNFGFLRMGTTGITAQEYGKENATETQLVFQRSLLISLVISLSLMLLSIPLCRASISILNVSEVQIPLVSSYFYIRILAAPASLAMYVLLGWFFGMQNSILPLIITVVVNFTNLILSYVFVVYFEWAIEGVALGTVIAQYLGVFLAILLLFLKYRFVFTAKWTQIKGTFHNWIIVLKVNYFLFIRTVCLTLAFVLFYAESSEAGAIVLATNVVLLQFLNWISYGIDGFAFASESLVGKYYGAQNSSRLQVVIRNSFLWGLVLALFYSGLFYLFDTEIVRIFSEDVRVLNAANDQRIWMIVLPIMAFSCYIWDGIYIGLTRVRLMMYAMILSLLIYILLIYVDYSNMAGKLWIALILFLMIRGVLQTLIWFKYIRLDIFKLSDR